MLHNRLTASVLCRRLLVLPFNRAVQMTPARAACILAEIKYCADAGGLLLLAPEHRLSLELRQDDLRLVLGSSSTLEPQRQEATDALALLSRVAAMPYKDIVDECDEVLRPQRQLVYAVGDPLDLPHGRRRWLMAQALLAVVRQPDMASALNDALGMWTTHDPHAPCHEWDRRVLMPDDTLHARLRPVHEALAARLLSCVPLDFQWLSVALSPSQRRTVTTFVCEPAGSVASLLESPGGLRRVLLEAPDRVADVLILRGLLAGGLLAHCLAKRPNVDYGVPRGRRTRLAVPYTAADAPHPRSEFAQPDKVIVLTLLAYYDRGLNLDQMRDALAALGKLGTCAQVCLCVRVWHRVWVRARASMYVCVCVPSCLLPSFSLPPTPRAVP